MDVDSPVELREKLNSNVVDLLNKSSIPNSLSLRSRVVSRSNVSNTRFGELTFGKFFPKFLNNCITPTNLLSSDKEFFNNISNNIDKFFTSICFFFSKI